MANWEWNPDDNIHAHAWIESWLVGNFLLCKVYLMKFLRKKSYLAVYELDVLTNEKKRELKLRANEVTCDTLDLKTN